MLDILFRVYTSKARTVICPNEAIARTLSGTEEDIGTWGGLLECRMEAHTERHVCAFLLKSAFLTSGEQRELPLRQMDSTTDDSLDASIQILHPAV